MTLNWSQATFCFVTGRPSDFLMVFMARTGLRSKKKVDSYAAVPAWKTNLLPTVTLLLLYVGLSYSSICIAVLFFFLIGWISPCYILTMVSESSPLVLVNWVITGFLIVSHPLLLYRVIGFASCSDIPHEMWKHFWIFSPYSRNVSLTKSMSSEQYMSIF